MSDEDREILAEITHANEIVAEAIARGAWLAGPWQVWGPVWRSPTMRDAFDMLSN